MPPKKKAAEVSVRITHDGPACDDNVERLVRIVTVLQNVKFGDRKRAIDEALAIAMLVK